MRIERYDGKEDSNRESAALFLGGFSSTRRIVFLFLFYFVLGLS